MLKSLCSLVAVSLFASLANTADSAGLHNDREISSGTCGDNLEWYYDSTSNKLTINGTGEMYDFSSSKPWASLLNSVTTVFIENGVVSVGSGAFEDSDTLRSVSISVSVTSIGSRAFASCSSLTTVIYQGTSEPESIGTDAFEGCDEFKTICTPVSYVHSSFGGKSVTCKEAHCGFPMNECFQVTDACSLEMSPEASSWTLRGNGCVEFFCDNITGMSTRSMCNDSGSLCTNNRCARETDTTDRNYKVEIEMDNVGPANTPNITAELSDAFHDATVIVKMDEFGGTVKIFVYVRDMESAIIVEQTVNRCFQDYRRDFNDSSSSSPNDKCPGILRYVKSTKVVEVKRSSSSSFVEDEPHHVVEVKKSSSSSVPKDDDKTTMFIIIGAAALGAVLIVVIIVVIASVACHKKNKGKKNPNGGEILVTDRSVYIVEDGVAMTDMSHSTSQPTSNTSSKSESNAGMIQAFQD